MRSFLINKNLCLYYWLKKTIGKKLAFEIATAIEKAILVFGRETIRLCGRDGMEVERKKREKPDDIGAK